MNEFKGTKGKWEYSDGDNLSIDIVLPNNTTISVDRYDRYGNGLVGQREEMQANALLISKAHEMLEMLTQTYLHIDALSKRIQDETYKNGLKGRAESIKKLIKEATEI